MEQEGKKRKRSVFSICLIFGIILGLITGLIGIYWVAINYLDPAWGWTVFFVALFALLLVIPMLRVRRRQGGRASYGKMLGVGSLVSLIAAIVVAICLFFATFAVNPNYVSNLRKYEIAESLKELPRLEKDGVSTLEAQKAAKMLSSALEGPSAPWPWIVEEAPETLFTGVIISLVLAILVQRRREEQA